MIGPAEPGVGGLKPPDLRNFQGMELVLLASLVDALLARHAIFPSRKDYVTSRKSVCEEGLIAFAAFSVEQFP